MTNGTSDGHSSRVFVRAPSTNQPPPHFSFLFLLAKTSHDKNVYVRRPPAKKGITKKEKESKEDQKGMKCMQKMLHFSFFSLLFTRLPKNPLSKIHWGKRVNKHKELQNDCDHASIYVHALFFENSVLTHPRV